MIKIENVVLPSPEQWMSIIRGARNPMDSWNRIDSEYLFESYHDLSGGHIEVGPNDHKLMTSLAKGGPVHAKYRRMITVYLDITAPLYWWKEFDTYKVGTVANSCSTMHKIHAKEFTLDDFSHEHLFGNEDMLSYDERADIAKDNALAAVNVNGDWCYFTPKGYIQMTCNILNHYRNKYLEAKTKPMKDESKRAGLMKKYWWQMIQLLPSSYNQKRTVMLSYEVLVNMYHSRKNHKLDEWREFCKWIEGLPYSEIIIGEKENV